MQTIKCDGCFEELFDQKWYEVSLTEYNSGDGDFMRILVEKDLCAGSFQQ